MHYPFDVSFLASTSPQHWQLQNVCSSRKIITYTGFESRPCSIHTRLIFSASDCLSHNALIDTDSCTFIYSDVHHISSTRASVLESISSTSVCQVPIFLHMNAIGHQTSLVDSLQPKEITSNDSLDLWMEFLVAWVFFSFPILSCTTWLAE